MAKQKKNSGSTTSRDTEFLMYLRIVLTNKRVSVNESKEIPEARMLIWINLVTGYGLGRYYYYYNV